jgi:hypothetical protein
VINRHTNSNKNKVKYYENRKKFKIYWINGFELEVIDLLHDLLNYERTEWRFICIPVLGKNKTNIIKAANKNKPTIITTIMANDILDEIEKTKKENITYFKNWINNI